MVRHRRPRSSSPVAQSWLRCSSPRSRARSRAPPDGLNKVALDHGFDRHAEESAAADSPLAGYA